MSSKTIILLFGILAFVAIAAAMSDDYDDTEVDEASIERVAREADPGRQKKRAGKKGKKLKKKNKKSLKKKKTKVIGTGHALNHLRQRQCPRCRNPALSNGSQSKRGQFILKRPQNARCVPSTKRRTQKKMKKVKRLTRMQKRFNLLSLIKVL